MPSLSQPAVETLGGHNLMQSGEVGKSVSSESFATLNDALQRARKAEREANQLRLEGIECKERISTLMTKLAHAKEELAQAQGHATRIASQKLEPNIQGFPPSPVKPNMLEEAQRGQKRLEARVQNLDLQNRAYEDQIAELMTAKGSLEAQLRESQRVFAQATSELEEKLRQAECVRSGIQQHDVNTQPTGNQGEQNANNSHNIVDTDSTEFVRGTRIASLEVEVSRLQAALKIAERTMTRSATEQLIKLEADKNAAEAESKRSATRADALKDQLMQETKLAADLSAECETTRTRLHDAETVIRTLRKRVQRLESLQETARTTAMQSEEQLVSAVEALKLSTTSTRQAKTVDGDTEGTSSEPVLQSSKLKGRSGKFSVELNFFFLIQLTSTIPTVYLSSTWLDTGLCNQKSKKNSLSKWMNLLFLLCPMLVKKTHVCARNS